MMNTEQTVRFTVFSGAICTAENKRSLKCNSRTKYQFWRLLHSCAERVHIIRKFAQSKLDVFFSGAICTAENKRSFTKSLNRMVGNPLLHIFKMPF